MEDVTALIDGYRECVRHVWNTRFWKDAEPQQDWDLRDEFNEIAARLFRALVLRKLGRDDRGVKPDHWAPREPLMFLRLEVDPRSEIMVNRVEETGYWDDPLRTVEKGQLDLRFLQFFDWSDLSFRDFAFYRVRIVGAEGHQHLLGRDALLPVGRA
jgi:hypothetical protein